MRQLTDRMTVAELQLEMEIQALRVRVSELETVVRGLSAAGTCACARPEAEESR